MTRGQRPQSTKRELHLHGWRWESSFGKEHSEKEKLKDCACVDALCWMKLGGRPERDKILSSGLDLKFLWGTLNAGSYRMDFYTFLGGPLQIVRPSSSQEGIDLAMSLQ